MIWRALVAWVIIAAGAPALAVTCSTARFEGHSFTICDVDPAQEDLRLFHSDADGQILGGFSAVDVPGQDLVFAMNAGMYHPDRRPVGFYREAGVTIAPALRGASAGNFGLLPNGVLCINEGEAHVQETLAYLASERDCRDATQSGPMLVVDGTLHPRFIPGSDSVHIRNGVGARADGTLVFAISNDRVNFDTFGRFFRDVLNTPNALFLDGKISRLFAPEFGRRDFGFTRLGPMVGVVAPR